MKLGGKIYFPLVLSAFFLIFIVLFFNPSFLGVWRYPLPKITKGDVIDQVKIKVDNFGTPHIYAENKKDLFYAYGYYLASERLFQMELQRRLAKGELSEIFGKDFVDIDKFFRTLKTHKYLGKNWQKALKDGDVPDNLKEIISSYLKGVNDFILRDRLPFEFYLLDLKPKLFTEEDIFSFIGYMSYSFATSFRGGLLYNDLSKKLPSNKFSDLRQRPRDLNFPFPYPQMGHIKFPQHLMDSPNEYTKVLHTLRGLFQEFPPFKGSNSWVVSGKKTKSGFPMLANDPHISFSLPGVWFEAHLKSKDFEIYGHFLPLIPLSVIGHNSNHAWAITMSKVDDMQFFDETLNPHNPRWVKSGKKWVQIKREEVTIKVKDEEDIIFPTESTPNGPLLHHILADKKGPPLSLYWSLYHSKNLPLLSLYHMNFSSSIEGFEQGLKHLKSPGLNISYIDKDQNIAWWLAGEVLIRPENITGDMIMSGRKGVKYLQALPFEENPKEINPESGYIVSANTFPPTMSASLKKIEGYWQPSDRYLIIESKLKDNDNLTIEDFKQIQNDQTDISSKTVLPLMLENLNFDLLTKIANEKKISIKLINKSLRILSLWDGDSHYKNPGITLYMVWYDELLRDVLMTSLDQESLLTYCDLPDSWYFINTILKNPDSKWWKNHQMKNMISESFIRTILILNEKLGSNPKKWYWGKLHTLSFKHPLGKTFPLTSFLNVGPYPVSGGPRQVNNMEFNSCTNNYQVKWGPSTRIVIDFENPKVSYGILPLGNSGRRFSPHYSDQLSLFLDGRYRYQLLDDSLIQKMSAGELIFEPR